MTDLIMYYPETLTQYNYFINLKLLRQKMWKPSINKNLENKTDITNLFGMTEYYRKQLMMYNYSYIIWDKFVIPENISDIIKKNSFLKDISYFIPEKFIFNNRIYDKSVNSIIHKINKNYTVDSSIEYILLKKFIINELSSFFPQNFNNFNNIDKKENVLDSIKSLQDFMILENIIILFSKNNNDIILFNEYLLMVFTNDYILILPNNKFLNQNDYLLLVNGKIYIKNDDMKMVEYSKKEYINNDTIYTSYGYIKNLTETQIFNCSINTNMVIKNIYNYTNKETKLNIKFYGIIFNKEGINIFKFNKNGCEFEEYINHNTNYRQIVSQCMIGGKENNGSELRYRGKYTETSLNNKNIKKTITFGDKIVYEKEGDETINNLLVDKKKYFNRTEMIIGYKVAKSVKGELRIVKLCITTDAQIIIPIDEEYFINHCKERCDKAIVMDIQLPNKNEEISVVPNEMVAYSYVYKSGKNVFEYKIGNEVIADSFNSNEDIGCAQGIHYFQSRSNLFEAYID